MKISVFGTGYVGLVTGVCFAEMGNTVTCMDIDATKIENLKKGQSPIYEPGLEEMLADNIKANRLHFTTDSEEAVAKSEVLVIAVGTPPNEDGSADSSYVLKVAETIAQYMTSYKLIVTKSTVPIGTNHRIKDLIASSLQKNSRSVAFDVCSNPEFLREGCAIQDCMKASRVVIGVESERAAKTMHALYDSFLKGGNPLLVMDLLSAEMTKYAANAMLAAKISLMNEFSTLCEKVGADVEHVRRGIGTDHRIGPYSIYPGIGYGGSCFPKDVKALIRTGIENSVELPILNAVEKINLQQRQRFFNKIANHFKSLKGLHFGVWGAAFKPGTDDIREAPSLFVIANLLKQGASVTVYDPVATENAMAYFRNPAIVGDLVSLAEQNLRFNDDQYAVLNGASALLIHTEWKSFKEPDFELIKNSLKAPLIFDGRNLYQPTRLKELGIEYYCIGRPS
jgi:UDPglucose 6-dehydrogenase